MTNVLRHKIVSISLMTELIISTLVEWAEPIFPIDEI